MKSLNNLTDEEFIREMRHNSLIGRDPLLTEAVVRLESTLDRADEAIARARELTDILEEIDDGNDT